MKSNRFIGILIPNCESVPTRVIAALGEVLRDLLHVNLEDVTISVLNEKDIMSSLTQKACNVEPILDIEPELRNIYSVLSSRIVLSSNLPGNARIIIFKEFLRAIAQGNAHEIPINRADLLLVLENICKFSENTAQKKKYIDATEEHFIVALFQLAREYEKKRETAR